MNISKMTAPDVKSCKVLPPKVNRLIGRAMHSYDMLSDGDRILIAVSGGVDSLFLARVLDLWRDKAPISYEIMAVHLDMGFAEDTAEAVEVRLKKLGIPYLIEHTGFGKGAETTPDARGFCFDCAKKRRNRLFEIARDKGMHKIAFGHHMEDIIETFFLNLFYAGNLSTMVPRQDLFDGRLAIIRPLAFLEKKVIQELASHLGISAVPNPCPLSDRTKRMEIRRTLQPIMEDNARIKANIFQALGNIKLEYLLKARIPPQAPPRGGKS